MNIGIIGVGNIGGTLAKKLVAAGHNGRIANSRGPESLADLAEQTARMASTIDGALVNADAIIITLPYKVIEELPDDLFIGAPELAAIIDAGNYYPMRDGRIDALDCPIANTQWVTQRFGRPIVKAFNSISANSLRSKGWPRGSLPKIALPVSEDDQEAKRVAFTLVEDAGFKPIGRWLSC